MDENENIQDGKFELVGSGGALEAQTRAEVDIQISTARKYPRVLSNVKSNMLSTATLDEETAASCFYSLPRGGKTIQGPSVRLAEIALSCYGNVKAATRIIASDTHSENPHVVIQAIVHDLQNNVVVGIEKRRRITGKKSKGGKPDEDDIQLAVNACSAIAFRDAVFKVVPMALVKPVFDAAKRVAIGDAKSLSQTREKVIGRLKQMGAIEANIYHLLGVKKIDEVTTEHVETLIGLGTAIKDGNITVESAFPAPVAESAPSDSPFKKKELTVQEQLSNAFRAKLVSLEDLNRYLVQEEFITEPVSDWSKIPADVATKLMKSVDAVVAQIGGGK